jgi:thioredoxin reductase
VLVVGGGDSALEAAASIAEQSDAKVAISYRGDAFFRAKPQNRARIDRARQSGRLHVLYNSRVQQIAADAVVVEQNGKVLRLPNEAVLIATGGLVPTDFLKNVGVRVQTKYGTA